MGTPCAEHEPDPYGWCGRCFALRVGVLTDAVEAAVGARIWQHARSCTRWSPMPGPCSCGLTDFRAALDALVVPRGEEANDGE